MSPNNKKNALDYHKLPRPGKIAIEITKKTDTQEDLSLAYTPGVAEPVLAIAKDPITAYDYTSKGNLVGVITNGSAVLGLGNVGPLASKPVMEGKGVLFKKFADIDVFDIEVECSTPQEFIATVARISPTFGGINLEDIKAPECFEIENALIEQLDIPVFHDDQHGTAIIIAAGLLNALQIAKKNIEDIKIICLGAGAAGIASMKLLTHLGVERKNIYLVDRSGVVTTDRTEINAHKFAFAQDTDIKTLDKIIEGADVFIGVSGANLLSQDNLKKMARNPIVFALSNPDPEISPELAHEVRNDLIMATGRSDYPNQINNVLCFPYIFRGALDARATKINIEMQIAAVKAISSLTHEEVPKEVLEAYKIQELKFSKDYIIPKPFDVRLRDVVSQAVFNAAHETGVAKV